VALESFAGRRNEDFEHASLFVHFAIRPVIA
jgi:hypothetical protein